MRRGGFLLACLAAVALALSAWVSTAGNVSVLRGASPATDREPGATPLPQPTQPPSGQPRTPPARPQSMPFSMLVVVFILLGLFALLLIVMLWHRRQRMHRDLLRTRSTDVEPEVDEDDLLDLDVPRALSRSARRSLDELQQGSPRNAIVRCWVTLEDAVAEAGLPHDPTLTSEELTAAVLQRYSVGRRAIETLAGLYREARFSTHELDESHRTLAVRALNALRDDLDLAVARAASASERLLTEPDPQPVAPHASGGTG